MLLSLAGRLLWGQEEGVRACVCVCIGFNSCTLNLCLNLFVHFKISRMYIICRVCMCVVLIVVLLNTQQGIIAIWTVLTTLSVQRSKFCSFSTHCQQVQYPTWLSSFSAHYNGWLSFARSLALLHFLHRMTSSLSSFNHISIVNLLMASPWLSSCTLLNTIKKLKPQF